MNVRIFFSPHRRLGDEDSTSGQLEERRMAVTMAKVSSSSDLAKNLTFRTEGGNSLTSPGERGPASLRLTSPSENGPRGVYSPASSVLPVRGNRGGGVTTTTTYTSKFMAAAAKEVCVTSTAISSSAAPSPSPATPSSNPQASSGRRAASRFQFFSEERGGGDGPTELQRLERDTVRRRQEFKRKVRDLGNEIATWTARLANETVERDRHFDDLAQRAVGVPLENAVERVMARMEERLTAPFEQRPERSETSSGEEFGAEEAAAVVAERRTTTKSKIPTFQEVESRSSRLDSGLLEHAHKTVYDARVRHIDSVRSRLREEAYPSLRLETTKANKREGGMVRTFEGAAASAAHSLAEENAGRVAELGMLKEEVERVVSEKETVDERKMEEWLGGFLSVREALEGERRERQQADERVMDQIIKTKEVLQRTVLESLANV